MKIIFDKLLPDSNFWDAYTDLWNNSQYQSSFQSPHFLQSLVLTQKVPLVVLRGYRDEKLIGATCFYNRGKEFHFLSDLKTDHNYFILHKSIANEETKQYFKKFLEEIGKRKWNFRLNKQPSWAVYMPIFQGELSESQLFGKVVTYNPCLVLEAESPEALFKATNKQKLRQKLNRLKEIDEVTFEAFRGEEDLDHWLEEFYELHTKKWAGTSTPSSYIDSSNRHFYRSCILAWIKDGILVRFAIKSGSRRIAFVTALLENTYLVHHTTTFDLDYEKQSPGLIIINLIGRWMADHNMTKMEFGDGGEDYKYQFTKQELPLLTIFMANRMNFPYILKTKLIKFVRENKNIHDFYNVRIRPVLLRSRVMNKKVT
jgi:Acetyltransferase (GNAT) domain